MIYKDYAIDHARFEILAELADKFVESLLEDVSKYADDRLSNSKVVHITGTEQQSNCPLWFKKRVILVTAEILLVCI